MLLLFLTFRFFFFFSFLFPWVFHAWFFFFLRSVFSCHIYPLFHQLIVTPAQLSGSLNFLLLNPQDIFLLRFLPFLSKRYFEGGSDLMRKSLCAIWKFSGALYLIWVRKSPNWATKEPLVWSLSSFNMLKGLLRALDRSASSACSCFWRFSFAAAAASSDCVCGAGGKKKKSIVFPKCSLPCKTLILLQRIQLLLNKIVSAS